MECQRCGVPTPPHRSPAWDDWEPSPEGGWLCLECLDGEVRALLALGPFVEAGLADLIPYEVEMDGQWGDIEAL